MTNLALMMVLIRFNDDLMMKRDSDLLFWATLYNVAWNSCFGCDLCKFEI